MELTIEKEKIFINHQVFQDRRYNKCIECLITNNGCWEVISPKANPSGYVQLSNEYLHRLMFLAWYPYLKIPNGIEVNHSCDNPRCINPFHLHLGTHADNMQDAKIRNRYRFSYRKGEHNPSAKLTAEQVKEIRANKSKHRDIAKKYGISKRYVSKIKTFRTWAHLAQ